MTIIIRNNYNYYTCALEASNFSTETGTMYYYVTLNLRYH